MLRTEWLRGMSHEECNNVLDLGVCACMQEWWNTVNHLSNLLGRVPSAPR